MVDVPGVKRTRSVINGASRASSFARTAGAEVRQSRLRRHLTQKQMAARVGLSRSRLAAIEAGNGAALPLTNWFALADTLGRFLRSRVRARPARGTNGRRPPGYPATGHRVPESQAGFDDRMIELPGHTGRGWTDVALVKRAARVLVLIECVNVIGDLGRAFGRAIGKRPRHDQLAAAMGGEGGAFMVTVCWVVRDSARNREIVRRYAELFAARFTGSSRDWTLALTKARRSRRNPVSSGATRVLPASSPRRASDRLAEPESVNVLPASGRNCHE